MCNDYRRRRSYREYVESFSELKVRLVSPKPHEAPNLEPQDEIHPTDPAPMFRAREDGLEMVTARWWLVPWWHKGRLKDFKLTTFNARSEDLTQKRAFKDAYERRRCLVPADGWYEFSGPKGQKTKWYLHPRDEAWICFAGLWDRCKTSDAGTVESFTIVTQPAGAPLNALHDRAPVVLLREHWATWLDLTADVRSLLGPESKDAFAIDRVSGPQDRLL